MTTRKVRNLFIAAAVISMAMLYGDGAVGGPVAKADSTNGAIPGDIAVPSNNPHEGCNGYGQPKSGRALVAGKKFDWSGKWSTSFGPLIMEQKEGKVVGYYSFREGRLVGKINGRDLEGSWVEKSNKTGKNETGGFQMTLSKDGNAFLGHWSGVESGKKVVGKWDGSRFPDAHNPGKKPKPWGKERRPFTHDDTLIAI